MQVQIIYSAKVSLTVYVPRKKVLIGQLKPSIDLSVPFLRSEIRRKKAHVLIHELADVEYRHLVCMRSMVISRARNISPVRDFIPASSDWDRDIPERARSLLTVLFKKYNNAATSKSASASKPAKGIFAMAVKGHAEMKKKMLLAGKDEVDMYFSGISPVVDGFEDPLG
jgi:hypothetical protein